MGSSTIYACLAVGVALVLFLSLTKRSWAGYTVMPKRGAVVEATEAAPSRASRTCVQLPWPAIVDRDEGEWLIVGDVRIRAADVIRSDQALAYYATWIQAEPDCAEAYLLRAILLGYLHKSGEALAHCREAVRLDSQVAMSHFLLGNLEREAGDADRAIVEYEEALRLQPDFANAHSGRGAAWWAKGDAARALADFALAIELDSDNVTAWFGQGLAHCAHHDHAAGVADFDRVIALDPQRSEAYFSRAGAWAALGDLNRALEDLDDYLKINPQNSPAYSSRGNIYRALGEFDLALSDFDRAIRLYSGDPILFCNRGIAWSEKGEYQRALDDFADAVAIDPECAQAFNNQAWLLATCPQTEFRDGAAAVEAARESCRLTNYQDVTCLDTLAAACAAAGDFDAACNWQHDVIERSSEDEATQQTARARLQLYQRGVAFYDVDAADANS